MDKILGKVPMGEKIGYSLGDAAANLVFQMMMIYQTHDFLLNSKMSALQYHTIIKTLTSLFLLIFQFEKMTHL